MKKSTKRLLSMIMALAMILSLLPVMAFAATITGGTVLYLTPNSNWKVDNARFAAYFFGNGEAWASATAVEGETNLYQVIVPSGNWTNVIFCRMNPSATANNWNNKWNQTADLTYDGTKNHYTVKSGTWDKGGGTWSTYTPSTTEPSETTVPTEPPVPVIALPGAFNSWNVAEEMTVVDNVATMTLELMAIDYEFKVIKDGQWMGYNGTINDATEGVVFSASVQNNCILKATGGIYTFTFDISTDTLSIAHTPNEGEVVEEPDYSSPVIEGGKVTFNYWNAAELESVVVCGTMAGWTVEEGIQMTQDPESKIWSATVSDLYNGDYAYKFVINGVTYTYDPKNAEETDADGNSLFTITESIDKPVVPKNVTLHVQANQAWEKAYAYYWVGQTNLVTWPGKEMTIEEGYAGWYSITLSDYTEDAINVIFTNNSGIQTNDLAIAALPEGNSEYWYVPGADAWGKGTLTNEAPAAYVQQETATCQVTVHFQNKLGWETVNGYAWTNTWPAQYPAEPWPGTALTEEDGWYTVSFNATYPVGDDVFVIFNDGNGQQTDNLCITIDAEESVERWVVPIGQQTEYLSEMCEVLYGKPASPVAEIYNKGCFLTFEDAYAAADPDAGDSIVLLSDITVNDLVVDKEMYLDLNGCNATINAASATHNIYAQDSATVNDQATQWGTLITNGVECLALGGYLMLPETEGYSFHCYDIYISHVSLKPNSDALGFKAKVVADSAVMAAITEFGFEMSVADGEIVTVTKEAGEDFDGVFTLRLQGIMAGNGSEMEITATPFVIMNEEQMYGSSETTTMKQTIRQIDNTWENYSAEEQTAVRTYANNYYSVMQHWDLKNIFVTIDIPIESAA